MNHRKRRTMRALAAAQLRAAASHCRPFGSCSGRLAARVSWEPQTGTVEHVRLVGRLTGTLDDQRYTLAGVKGQLAATTLPPWEGCSPHEQGIAIHLAAETEAVAA